MKNKHFNIKIIVMMAVICLLGINYGYWSEQLMVNGEASLLVQVSVVDLVKTETVTKEAKHVIKVKKSEDNGKVSKEKDDIKADQEKDASKGLLPDDSSDKEKIDLKGTGREENEESIIDEEVSEDKAFAEDKSFTEDTSLEVDMKLEEDKNNEVSEMDKDTAEEINDLGKQEISDDITVDKDNEKAESNHILDEEVDLDIDLED